MNLEQLIKPSLFHKVLNRTPNAFQIVPANRSEGCLDGFNILVEEAMKAEATSGYKIQPHKNQMDPMGRYDAATITHP